MVAYTSNPKVGRSKQEDHECEVSVDYMVSSRLA